MSAVIALPADCSVDMQMDTRAPLTFIESLSWGLTDASVTQMPIGSILVSPNGDAQATDLDGLVTSIRKRGVLQPLIIAPNGRLLAGRRRLEAARRAGLELVPVHVCAVTSERSAIEISLVENVERSDLDPLTRAKSYHALIEHGATVEEVADLVGQGTRHVYQLLQLLDLHPDVQHAVHTRTLSFADARALVLLEHTDQVAVLQEIRASVKPLTSRQVKARVDARRVMRLVQKTVQRDEHPQKEGDPAHADSPQDHSLNGVAGNYAALFEIEEVTPMAVQEPTANPLEQLDALIAEMVAAAQGEDHVRGWARRLSHLLGTLRDQTSDLEKRADKKKSASAIQERLL